MNTSTKCNCCVSEQVCKYKPLYENAVSDIKETFIKTEADGHTRLKDCKFIEVSIRCPFMTPKSGTRSAEV